MCQQYTLLEVGFTLNGTDNYYRSMVKVSDFSIYESNKYFNMLYST